MPCTSFDINSYPDYIRRIFTQAEAGVFQGSNCGACSLKTPVTQDGCAIAGNGGIGAFPFCAQLTNEAFVGPGTDYPIAMNLDFVMKLYWKANFWSTYLDLFSSSCSCTYTSTIKGDKIITLKDNGSMIDRPPTIQERLCGGLSLGLVANIYSTVNCIDNDGDVYTTNNSTSSIIGYLFSGSPKIKYALTENAGYQFYPAISFELTQYATCFALTPSRAIECLGADFGSVATGPDNGRTGTSISMGASISSLPLFGRRYANTQNCAYSAGLTPWAGVNFQESREEAPTIG